MESAEPQEQEKLARLLHEFGDKASVRVVFGEPVRVGEVTVVPVAEVFWRAGRGHWLGPRFKARFGPRFGRGAPAAEPATPGQAPETPAGEAGPTSFGPPLGPFGAGGIGGQLHVRPLAALEISPSGTHVRPIRDTTRIVLAMFALIGWNVYWVTRTLRAIFGRRRRRQETIDAG